MFEERVSKLGEKVSIGVDMCSGSTKLSLDEVPSWSPDSRQILYSTDVDGEPQNGNYEIYIMNRDGSNKTRLTNEPEQDTYPSMSPDGKFIVFESYRDGHAEIYGMNADGSKVIRLTTLEEDMTPTDDEGPAAGNGNPSWSPFLEDGH